MIAAYYKRLTSSDQVFPFTSTIFTSTIFTIFPNVQSAHLIFHSGGAQGRCQGVVLVGNGHQQAHP